MDFPAPPTVYGIDTSSSDTSGSGFYEYLFKLYNSVTPQHHTTRFSEGCANGLQKEFNDIKRSINKNMVKGLKLELERNVSRYFQVKHNLQMDGAESRTPPYHLELVYDSEYKKYGPRYWNMYSIYTRLNPGAGSILTHLKSTFHLAREIDDPAPTRGSSHFSVEATVRTNSSSEKMAEGILDNVGVSFVEKGAEVNATYQADGSIEAFYTQQLSKQLFGTVLGYYTRGIAGLANIFRYESAGRKVYPRNAYIAGFNANNESGLVTCTLQYCRLFTSNFSWCAELASAPNQQGQIDIQASTGCILEFRSFSRMANLRMLLTHGGDLMCILEDMISPVLSYSLSIHSNLPKNAFSVGLGFNVKMDGY